MGSTSDLPVARKAADFLESMGIAFELHALSAHRTPEAVALYAATAAGRGVKIIIAIAGMAAALPGVIAAATPLPVIGVPAPSTLDGVDALLSIVQMPPAIPVATVGIGAGLNAAVLAARILAISDNALAEKLAQYTASLALKVEKADADLAEVAREYKHAVIAEK